MNIYNEFSNVYNHFLEIEDSQNKLKQMTDNVLDLYNKYPKECKKILIEINSLCEEFEDIEKQLETLRNEIY
jgi:hypothetical protein